MKKIKQYKYLITLMFAGLLICLGAGTRTEAAVVSGSSIEIAFTEEELRIESDKQIYFGVAKKATDTALKETYLKPAPKENGSNKYMVDISTLSATKNTYIGFTTDVTADPKGMVPVSLVEIPSAHKKVTFQINWAAEGVGGKDLFQSIKVLTSGSKEIVYRSLGANEAATDSLIDISKLGIDWKKGANGSWGDISTLTNAKWLTCLNSKATIYFRLSASDSKTAGHRMSKEWKIKPSASSLPNIKIDVNKLALSLKNGLEYRFAGTENWNTILPYSSKASMSAYLAGGKNFYDPSAHTTKTKVATMPINQILGTNNSSAYVVTGSSLSLLEDSNLTPATNGAFTLEVRTAATTKKPASAYRTITVPGQTAAPSATLTMVSGSSISYTFSALAKAPSDNTVLANFEYLMIAESDLPKLDMAKSRWTTAKDGIKISATTKSSFELSDGTKKTYTISDQGTVVLLRRKGISASSKATAVLPSQYLKITPTK